MVRDFDVVVAGGGPAGAATALRLATAGRAVAVVERTRFDGPRPGETLAPAVQPLLRALGVWDRFRALDPLPSWGVRSVWQGPEPVEHSHLTSVDGPGWHVDRRAVDRMLAVAAAGAGAELRTGTALAGCRHDGDRWEIGCADGRRLRARVLVDATGRRAGPGRALGARRLRFDRMVAVAAQCAPAADGEQYLLVEAVPEGWWYTAPVPGDGLVAMLMTDPDLCRAGGWAGTPGWHDRLRASTATARRVGAAPPRTAPRVHPAASHRLVRAGDHRPWLAVGDAALAVDPASGSGFVRALRSAQAAVATVADLLDRPRGAVGALAAHERARDEECTAHLVERAQQYGLAQRHPSPFWRRRVVGRASA